MTVYVLGGGPAGLALVHGLVEGGDSDFALFERSMRLGGLAQTMVWGDHGAHDLGPHKIFTQDADLLDRVNRLLPASDWLTRDKRSRIFLGGSYLPYPPSPLSLIGVFGVPALARMTLDYARARLRRKNDDQPAASFEEDLIERVGERLYRALFRPMAMKLWGDPATLDAKLSQGRVQTPSIKELVLQTLGLRARSQFEALTFSYPRGGLQRLWESIHERTKRRGSFEFGKEIVGFDVEGRRIRGIKLRERSSGALETRGLNAADFVFSTLPIGVLISALGSGIAAEVAARAREVVQLNDLVLVFLKVDCASLLDESWIFVPDPDIVFHRVSEQESFDPGMTPRGSIVCCEIMSHASKKMTDEPNTELVARVRRDLERLIPRRFEVEDSKVIRLPASYPVFRVGYAPALRNVLAELDRFENLRTVGRQGAFNYIGTLDAMDIGYGAARWFNAGRSSDIAWRDERARTEHYPVLD